ncbi:MAG: hypothetical protein J6A29_04995 [Clostridia bacterium]|nr:hypothetical protein [Clostridia bacterium]
MLKEKIKNFVTKKTEGNNKKNIENLVVFLILLIITVIAINMIWSKDEDQPEEEEASYKVLASENSNITENTEYDLQKELEDILSKMDGIGKVDVLITYSQTSTVVPMYSETESSTLTEETDSGGGTRKQESSNLNKEVITDGDNKAITQTVILPKVEGAIVIAEGGGNATTKANIIQAVSAVTGLATYKVQVFEMQK